MTLAPSTVRIFKQMKRQITKASPTASPYVKCPLGVAPTRASDYGCIKNSSVLERDDQTRYLNALTSGGPDGTCKVYEERC